MGIESLKFKCLLYVYVVWGDCTEVGKRTQYGAFSVNPNPQGDAQQHEK